MMISAMKQAKIIRYQKHVLRRPVDHGADTTMDGRVGLYRSHEKTLIESEASRCRDNMSPPKSPAIWFIVKAFPFAGPGKCQKFM
jgi:hypothetical protein